MTTIYMVRHGETEWNAAHRMQGWTDIPLNERGREQTLYVAKKFENIPLDVIYTSPLQRAKVTAEAIRGKRDIPVIEEAGIKEINLGNWDGHTPDEMDVLYPGQYDIWRNTPGEVHVEGGETFKELQERAWKTFLAILQKHKEKTILLVSHMGCLSTILFKIAGYPLNDLWKHPIGNCALCEVAVCGGDMDIVKWAEDDYIPNDLKMKVPFGRVK